MKQETITLSIKEARAIATYASKLHQKSRKKKVSKEDLYGVLRHLGMIQLDTISVITRTHETAIFSRLGEYDLSLWQELFQDKKITEYLAHAAAIVPTEDLPMMKKMMEHYKTEGGLWIKDPKNSPLVKEVLERIAEEGPLSSRDFDGPSRKNEAPWESWYGPKPERRILANLWAGGELLISLRDPSFSRWFDLPERVASEEYLIAREDHKKHIALRALQALGITNANWLRDYYRTGGKSYLSHREAVQMLKRLREEGLVMRTTVDGLQEPLYLPIDYLPYLEELREGRGWPKRTTFLSPFDNLIFNRRRMKELWGMDYTIEIYTPAEKRVYGYYTMPILYRGDHIGRIDPSYNRTEKLLVIRSLHLEEGIKLTKTMVKELKAALDELGSFLGAKEWVMHSCTPELREYLGDGNLL